MKCFLRWEIDGRSSDGNPCTRRLRICWGNQESKGPDSYILLIAPPKYDKSDLDFRHLLNDDTKFLGRRIGSKANKRNLIREFLTLCSTEHDGRCNSKTSDSQNLFIETLTQPYFGVIDIESQSLVPLQWNKSKDNPVWERYAALSYVWGTDRKHRTVLANIQDRRKSGGLAFAMENLPDALRQSITLVHDLGIRYIWIDALCIVQDSGPSWNLNANAMHLIYRNAAVTICSADGQDAHAGLVAMRKDNEAGQKASQEIFTCAEGVHLILHKPPEMSIAASHWNNRAWTFQERLLSKRCVIFADGKIYFQCRSTSMSEDIFTDLNGEGWSLDLVNAPLQSLSQLSQRAMWFYMTCILEYTKREIYEPFDILAAFSGMCKLIEGTLKAPLIFGLPTSHFDLALLWEHRVPASRLKEAKTNDAKYKDLKFPTWSWCGWENNGTWYNHETILGCLADPNAWLSDHTWIDWHIRNGYGTPRRVWDREYAEEDESINSKWKGYKVRRNQGGLESSGFESMHFTGSTLVKTMQTSNRQSNSMDLATFGSRDGPLPEDYDNYGRPYSGVEMTEALKKPRDKFELTLPEYPYQVPAPICGPFDNSYTEFEDQPVLQFFTWMTSFCVIAPRNEDKLPSCHVIDSRGNKCGFVRVGREWFDNYNESWHKEHKTGLPPFEFIAISEAKSFTKEELPDWSYYIPNERIDSEWDVYFVLLVERFQMEGIYRRVGLGKVFKKAFTHSEEEWKEVILG
ncbi:heterokaryon incompatibility protein-domain-containing protein [Camillea tinctor]|nr:heterokaryon incompatibility protein-domain-containing protein [Camillea tinctor]